MVKYLKITILLLVIPCFSSGYVGSRHVDDTLFVPLTVDTVNNKNEVIPAAEVIPKPKESRRVVAVLLCATLGPFGMHRLYLGTEPQVAAAYAVTLGGGFGFVTVVDLFFLVFSKDISRFKNNPRFIMWKRP
jgi:TM2 domain-containing membrane protein YozV